jgi:hypothetical protein
MNKYPDSASHQHQALMVLEQAELPALQGGKTDVQVLICPRLPGMYVTSSLVSGRKPNRFWTISGPFVRLVSAPQ